MDKILDKISSYSLFNHLVPGIVFVLLLKFFCGIALAAQDLAKDFILYYLIGLIVNAVGSIVVEWLFKSIGAIKHEPYEKFLIAEKKDAKIATLLEVNNMHRGIFAAFIMIFTIKMIQIILDDKNFYSHDSVKVALSIIAMVLLGSYYVKQNKYITRRVENGGRE